MYEITVLPTPQAAIKYLKDEFEVQNHGGQCKADYIYCCEKAADVKLHANGDNLLKLFKERFPNEPEKQDDYRLQNTKILTKGYFDKIGCFCQKIQRSAQFAIDFEHTKGVLAKDTQTYLTEKYKHFESLENWIFQICLERMLIDSNAVCIVLPQSWEINATSAIEPYTYIYESHEVLIYNEETVFIQVKKDKWFLATLTEFWDIELNDKEEYTPTLLRKNDLGLIPAFRLGGLPCRTGNNMDKYDSFIRGVVPAWDSAITEYSNFIVTLFKNCFPEKWRMKEECAHCMGSGQQPNRKFIDKSEPCSHCGGKNSPFASVTYVKAALRQGDPAPQIPPAGYIVGDYESIKILAEQYPKSILQGLAAINLEHLADTPLNISGNAKELDRSDSQAFLHGIAKRVSHNYQMAAYYITKWRNINQNEQVVRAAIPIVHIPVQFDIHSLTYYQTVFQNLRAANASDAQLAAAEEDAIKEQFSANSDKMQYYMSIFRQQPCRYRTPDELLSAQLAGVVTKEDVCLHYNIEIFTNQLVEEDKNYLNLEFTQQRELLLKLATEYINANKVAPIPTPTPTPPIAA